MRNGGTAGVHGARVPDRARIPTMADVAARAGVSKALVSIVFRNAPGASAQTRARVLRAADQIGYRHNRTASLLARRRTDALGVTLVLRNPYHTELVEELQVAAAEQGYELVLSPVSRARDERRAIETVLELRCEALILVGPEMPTADLAALSRQLPVVVLGRRTSAPVDVVRTADDEGVRQAVDHLVALGHRDIVHVDGGRGTIAADRRRGYRAAVRHHGLPPRLVPGGYTEEVGARAGRDLLDAGNPPTAVVAANDRCALGLLDTLARAGVDVPGAMSVVGYDDSPLSRLAYVNLTTVSQEPHQQALAAVASAAEVLDGRRAIPREVVLTPRLVPRATTGPAPH